MREAVEVVDDGLNEFLARVGVMVLAAFLQENKVVAGPIELVAVEMVQLVTLGTWAVPDLVHGVVAKDAAFVSITFKIS